MALQGHEGSTFEQSGPRRESVDVILGQYGLNAAQIGLRRDMLRGSSAYGGEGIRSNLGERRINQIAELAARATFGRPREPIIGPPAPDQEIRDARRAAQRQLDTWDMNFQPRQIEIGDLHSQIQNEVIRTPGQQAIFDLENRAREEMIRVITGLDTTTDRMDRTLEALTMALRDLGIGP